LQSIFILKIPQKNMDVLNQLVARGRRFGTRLNALSSNDGRVYQRKVLNDLLRAARGTAFGQHYKFDKILQYKDVSYAFANEVPTHDYNKLYAEWWHRSVAQEPNVCWQGTVKYFALSSGTSGAPSKYIPITPEMTKSMQKAGRKMFFSFIKHRIDPAIFTKGMMMVGGSASLNYENGFFSGDLSGINANKVPYWLRGYYKPGVEIARISDWNSRIDKIAENAADWDIGFMAGIPSWIQLMLERVMEHHKLSHIHEIWPNLSVYVSGGVALEPYKQSMNKMMGKPLHYIDSYLASEGFVAFQNRPDAPRNAMAMILNNGIYFEFVPFNDANFDSEGNLRSNHLTLDFAQIEEGVDYALLLTTCAGAWRYLIGDTVRFSDKKRGEIHITGRTKHFLSITGEHLSVDNMNYGVQEAAKDFGVSVREFTVAAAEIGDGQFEHRWYIGCDAPASEVLFQQHLDNYLKAVNDDYKTERGAFLGLKVRLVPNTLFYRFQEKFAKFDGQAKFPRVMKADRFALWEDFVRESRA
jgi:GH3 auxin-responsive promoter